MNQGYVMNLSTEKELSDNLRFEDNLIAQSQQIGLQYVEDNEDSELLNNSNNATYLTELNKLKMEIAELENETQNHVLLQEQISQWIQETQNKSAHVTNRIKSTIEVLTNKIMAIDTILIEKETHLKNSEKYWSSLKRRKDKEYADFNKRSKENIKKREAEITILKTSLSNTIRQKLEAEKEINNLQEIEANSETTFLRSEQMRIGYQRSHLDSQGAFIKIQMDATTLERQEKQQEIQDLKMQLRNMPRYQELQYGWYPFKGRMQPNNKSLLTVLYTVDNSSAFKTTQEGNYTGSFPRGGGKSVEDVDRTDLESDWTEVVEEFRSRLNRTTDTAVLWLVSLYALVFALGVAGNGVLLRLACCSKPTNAPVQKKPRTNNKDEETQTWRHFTAAHFLNRNNKGTASPKNNFYSAPKRRKRNNPVLVNLCVADLLVLLVCCPMAAYTSATKVWVLGKGMCKALAYFQGVAVTSGTLSLTALSLDRYLFTRHPGVFEKVRRRRLSAGMVIGVWTLSALLSAPVILVRTTQDLRLGPFTFDFCVELWQHQMARRAFTLVTLTIVYALPCAVLIACHASVSWTLRLATGAATLATKDKSKITAHKTGSSYAEEKLLSRNRIRQRAFRVKDRCEHSSGCFSSENSHSQVYPNSSYCSSGSNSARGTLTNYSGVDSPSAPPNSQAETACGSRAHHKRHVHHANRHYRTRTGVVVNMSSEAGDTVFSDGSCCRHSSTGTDATSNLQGNSGGDWGSNSGGTGYKNRNSYKNKRTIQRSQRARRHLANVLMGMTLCFVACWLPYNAASFYVDLYPSPSLASTLPFVLLLGHAHSAVNPFVYWLLNESARRRQTSAAPEEVLRSRSSLLRMHTPVYKLQAALDALTRKTEQSSHQMSVCDSPSTTENALGVFHPRFTPNRPLPPNIRL